MNRGSRFSWMALVAATTLGPNAVAGTLRAQVKAQVPQNGDSYRLVVHSYDAARDGEVPFNAKPVGSAQMSVTAMDLERGVDVNLVEVRSQGKTGSAPMVVAWLESGKPDLDFDGREARPNDQSIVGKGRADSDYVALTLSPSRLVERISRTRRSKSRAV
ncbi:MAG: hypothetical protein ABI461_23150 [Polyangiaceae bacterium]